MVSFKLSWLSYSGLVFSWLCPCSYRSIQFDKWFFYLKECYGHWNYAFKKLCQLIDFFSKIIALLLTMNLYLCVHYCMMVFATVHYYPNSGYGTFIEFKMYAIWSFRCGLMYNVHSLTIIAHDILFIRSWDLKC